MSEDRLCPHCGGKGTVPPVVTWYPSQRRRREKIQEETRRVAHNAGKQWTGAELEILEDRSRTAQEVAKLLGRSLAAVKTKRLTRERLAREHVA